MSARTGLSPVEVGLPRAVDLPAADDHARCSDVLVAAAATDGLGPRYAWPVLVDLGVPWRRHQPLVELHGNSGSRFGDLPADAQYVEVRLSPVGELALAAEREEVGPVPLGLVEGSWYADGPVPPFDPERVVGALLSARATDAGGPSMPSGGRVVGDVDRLLAGQAVRLRLECTITAVGGDLVITGFAPASVATRCCSSSPSARATTSAVREGARCAPAPSAAPGARCATSWTSRPSATAYACTSTSTRTRTCGPRRSGCSTSGR